MNVCVLWLKSSQALGNRRVSLAIQLKVPWNIYNAKTMYTAQVYMNTLYYDKSWAWFFAVLWWPFWKWRIVDEWGLYCNHIVRPSVRPSVHTFVTDISASTGRNDSIFDIWLWHGDLYHVSPFQVYRTSTSCLLCDLQMNEWGYS